MTLNMLIALSPFSDLRDNPDRGFKFSFAFHAWIFNKNERIFDVVAEVHIRGVPEINTRVRVFQLLF